jgi:hypothetical protein
LETRSFDPERIEAARRSLSALVNRLRELPPTILRLFSDTSTTAPSGLTTWDEAYLKSIYGMTEPMQLPRAYIAHSMVSQIVP